MQNKTKKCIYIGCTELAEYTGFLFATCGMFLPVLKAYPVPSDYKNDVVELFEQHMYFMQWEK